MSMAYVATADRNAYDRCICQGVDQDDGTIFLTGPGVFALFDAPWTPVFIGIIYLFHPILGGVAAAGAILLLLLWLVIQGIKYRLFLRRQRQVV